MYVIVVEVLNEIRYHDTELHVPEKQWLSNEHPYICRPDSGRPQYTDLAKNVVE